MKSKSTHSIPFFGQASVLLLASAIAVPAFAQQTQATGDSSATAGTTLNAAPASAPASVRPATPQLTGPAKEGFWGRLNPLASKKWVKKRTDPISDRLVELDAVNAKNSRDIQDVDQRAQAGIHQAQSTADAANGVATVANDKALKAGTTAQGASGHVDQLNTTVNGLDQYRQVSEVEVPFRGGQPVISSAARAQLDDLATSLSGHQGYILEMEAHSPAAGSTGIQNSERLAEAVKRYLVTEHQIPVYRLHSVALGNLHSETADADETHKTKTSGVHIRLMENSLAVKGSASAQVATATDGAERP